MIKSNSKAAKEAIKNYIMAGFDGSGYGINKPETFKGAAFQIMKVFHAEVVNGDKTNRSLQELFVYWCEGLPSIIDCGYYITRSAVDDLGAILQESEPEKKRYTEREAEKMITWLMFRELREAVRS